MEFQPIDLPAVIGITMGTMVVLIPVLGATIRFAAKPLIELLVQHGVIGAAAQANAASASKRDLDVLTRRVLELEQELNKVKALPRPAPIAELPSETSSQRGPELLRVR